MEGRWQGDLQTLQVHSLPYAHISRSSLFVQCEDRCKVRACLPTPKRGALPLPGGLPADLLAFEPQASGGHDG